MPTRFGSPALYQTALRAHRRLFGVSRLSCRARYTPPVIFSFLSLARFGESPDEALLHKRGRAEYSASGSVLYLDVIKEVGERSSLLLNDFSISSQSSLFEGIAYAANRLKSIACAVALHAVTQEA